MCFQSYGLPKTLLDRYRKRTASEYSWKINMVIGHKHCSNMNGGTFIMFIDHYEKN